MPYDGAGNYALPGGYLAVTGGTVLASQHNPPLEDIQAALSQVLLLSGVKAMTGDLTLASSTPGGALVAASRGYVDGLVVAKGPKTSVRAATTANITLSGAQVIDGVSVVAGDRVLVKAQTTGANNGIYVAAAGAWGRAADMDSWAEVPSSFVFVEEGTVGADTGWVFTNNQGGTLGSTAIVVVQMAGPGAYAPYSAGLAAIVAAGILGVATTAQLRAMTANYLVDLDGIEAAQAVVNLAAISGSAQAVDLSLGFNFAVNNGSAVAAPFTLSNPSNVSVGKGGYIKIPQDATGGRVITYGSNWLFDSGVKTPLSTAGNAVDYLYYFAESATRIHCQLYKAPA